MTSLYGLTPSEVEELVRELGEAGYRVEQLLQGIYRQDAESVAAIGQLPAALREALVAHDNDAILPREVRRVVSDDGQTTKVLLEMAGGTLIETVLMQYPETGRHPRSTVCVSTQAGCAMACVFCATGQMGFGRNLEVDEIVSQVVHFQRILRGRGEHVTNVVFMGMGEPLANYNATAKALHILTDPRAFGLGQRHITVSTVGVVHGIDRLAAEGLQVNLAISLHAPNDGMRRRLVPTASPNSVGELIAAAGRYFAATGRRVTFEYALIEGENDTPETASELAGLLAGLGTHVNLIPINPTAGRYARPDRGRVVEFERILRAGGVNCTVRVEKGTEISAACGQLRTDAENPLMLGLRPVASGRQPEESPQTLSPTPSQTQ